MTKVGTGNASGGLLMSVWCFACLTGELLGLGSSFALLALARELGVDGFDQTTPVGARLALGLAVGAIEGGSLGMAQALALKVRLPHLSAWRFAGATALPAALVWATVLALMNPGDTTGPVSSEPPMMLIVLVGAVGGLSGGVLMGAFQALAVLRMVGRRRALLWIAASATGWAAGLAVIMVATTLQDEHTPTLLVALFAGLGAALGGLALGLASFWGARRLTVFQRDGS
jgi:hypothetical protein